MTGVDGGDEVRLPDGRLLRRTDLPLPGERFWSAQRKAAVVLAVEHGLVTHDEAMALWGLSQEELRGWRAAHARDGVAGLRAKAAARLVVGGKPNRSAKRKQRRQG